MTPLITYALIRMMVSKRPDSNGLTPFARSKLQFLWNLKSEVCIVPELQNQRSRPRATSDPIQVQTALKRLCGRSQCLRTQLDETLLSSTRAKRGING